jgi:hypothetical protein
MSIATAAVCRYVVEDPAGGSGALGLAVVGASLVGGVGAKQVMEAVPAGSATFQGMDLGLSNKASPIPLRSLGTVSTLTP